MWVLGFIASASGVGCSALPRLVEPHGERGSWYIGSWSVSCSTPRQVGSSHRPPRAGLRHAGLATLLSEEGIDRCLRDAPVATVELVGALEPALLAPVADRGRRAPEAGGQLGHREVGRHGGG